MPFRPHVPLISNLQQLPVVSFSHNTVPVLALFLFVSVSPCLWMLRGRLPVGGEPWFLFNSLFLSASSKGDGGRRGEAQCCHLVVRVMTVRVQLSGSCVFQGGWKLSRPKTGAHETEKRRVQRETVISSVSHSWITQTCSAFYNLEGIFWQSCTWPAVPGSVLLQRPPTPLHSSA